MTEIEIPRRDDEFSHDCDLCLAASTAFDAEKLTETMLKEIAAKFMVPATLLRRRLRLPGTKRVWNVDSIAEFKAAASSGKNNAAIAEQFGVSASSIPTLAKRFEVDLSASRRAGKLAKATRVAMLTEGIVGLLTEEPTLDAESVTAWLSLAEVIDDSGIVISQDEIESVAKKVGIEFGTVRAMPRELSEPAPKPKAKTKGVPNKAPTDAKVDVIELPEEKADDVVEVDQQVLSWVKKFYVEHPDGNIEDYKSWAEDHPAAPDTTTVRHVAGSWGEAKRLALA